MQHTIRIGLGHGFGRSVEAWKRGSMEACLLSRFWVAASLMTGISTVRHRIGGLGRNVEVYVLSRYWVAANLVEPLTAIPHAKGFRLSRRVRLCLMSQYWVVE